MGRPGRQPRPFVTTWTPELAWVVGLIATDGCLASDGRHVDITSNDAQVLEAVRRCVVTGATVRTKGNGHGGRSHRLQIGSSVFHTWLRAIGLMPKKSKVLGAVQVPDCYYWDFLRGCFDGDGSWYANMDGRWRSSYAVSLRLYSASPAFLRWIQHQTHALGGPWGTVQQGKGVEQLQYAKRASFDLFSRMYHATDVPCLERKRAQGQRYADVAKLVHAHA